MTANRDASVNPGTPDSSLIVRVDVSSIANVSYNDGVLGCWEGIAVK